MRRSVLARHAPRGCPTNRNAWRLLIFVGVGYAIAQLLLFNADRAPSWDEAIYLSQVAPEAESLPFAASRARGITLLVAPVAALGASTDLVRLWLIGATSGTFVFSFGAWIPTVGMASPIAALLLGFSWLGLFYGSEVMPNLFTALLAVWLVGHFVRLHSSHFTWRDGLVTSLLFGAMTLMRPLDAITLAAALGVFTLVMRADRVRRLVSIVLGLAMGLIPWTIEMAVRFGDIGSALNSARQAGHLGITFGSQNVVHYLELADGPTLGPEVGSGQPIAGIVWLIAIGLLLPFAYVSSRVAPGMKQARTAAMLAVALLAALYLFFVSGVAARFLLPAWALLCIPLGVAALSLFRRFASRPAGVVLVGCFVLTWFGWQVQIANEIDTAETHARDASQLVGLTLREITGRAPCVFINRNAFPQIALASGCRSERWSGLGHSVDLLAQHASEGHTAFLVLRSSDIPPVEGLELRDVVQTAVGEWSIVEVAAGLGS